MNGLTLEIGGLERMLTALFDYQRFEQNPVLQSVIDGVDLRFPAVNLDEEDLSYVAAAGEALVPPREEEPR